MPQQHPVNELMNDHRLIERVMSALEARLVEEGGDFPGDFVAQALAFFVEFADGHHHYKEEESLFPALAGHGVPVEGGPIGMMLHEHNLGRQLLAGIRDNLAAARGGDPEARAAVRRYAGDYVGLLRNHIWKEDNVLFRMAQHVLDEQAVRGIEDRFQSGAHDVVSRERVARYVEFASGL
jgi:hemerythrin-like domain-containing protein